MTPWIDRLAAKLDKVAWSEHSIADFTRLIREAVEEERRKVSEGQT